MSFNRPLNVRVRKINPYKRMKHTHPFYIWQVLMRLRTMNKLIGEDDKWHTREDIARMLFSNFDELEEADKRIVLMAKLNFPMAFLKGYHYIKERSEQVRNPAYYNSYYRSHNEMPTITKDMNEFQAHPRAFGDLANVDLDVRRQWTADSIDQEWGFWIGRPDYEGRARRWLKKEGILP